MAACTCKLRRSLLINVLDQPRTHQSDGLFHSPHGIDAHLYSLDAGCRGADLLSQEFSLLRKDCGGAMEFKNVKMGFKAALLSLLLR